MRLNSPRNIIPFSMFWLPMVFFDCRVLAKHVFGPVEVKPNATATPVLIDTQKRHTHREFSEKEKITQTSDENGGPGIAGESVGETRGGEGTGVWAITPKPQCLAINRRRDDRSTQPDPQTHPDLMQSSKHRTTNICGRHVTIVVSCLSNPGSAFVFCLFFYFI